MSTNFEEAPVLPQDLSEKESLEYSPPPPPPSLAGSTQAAPSTLPPPPKFPSLTDVALPHATAAAAEAAVPSSSTAPEFEEEDFLHVDADAAIRRDSVEPGFGARRALEIASEQWTDTDQENLDRLLAEGQDVLVPPDVCSDDLPVPPASGYSYFPAEAEDDPTGWHKLVPTAEPRPVSPLAVSERYTPFPSTSFPPAPVSPVLLPVPVVQEKSPPPVVQRSFDPNPVQTLDEVREEDSPSADVSRTIFGGHFHVIPVKSRVNHDAGNAIVLADPKLSTEDNPIHRVTLRLNSTADVNVREDYGLKGGHDDIVHDAVFLNGDKTLVTCGADGRVCVWDMVERTVQREFIPYDGEPVTMIYPLPDDEEENSSTTTIMTLSESRSLRIWIVDDYQAIMLRDSKVQECGGDLYMNVPRISKQLKARAIAAAAAAAIRTSDAPEESVLIGTAEEIEEEREDTREQDPVQEGYTAEQEEQEAPESAYVVEPAPTAGSSYSVEPVYDTEPSPVVPSAVEDDEAKVASREKRGLRQRLSSMRSSRSSKKALAS